MSIFLNCVKALLVWQLKHLLLIITTQEEPPPHYIPFFLNSPKFVHVESLLSKVNTVKFNFRL